MGVNSGRIEAIGINDGSSKTNYTSQVKKKNPYIDNIFAGFGSYINNLSSGINSVFTTNIGKDGGQETGAFRA